LMPHFLQHAEYLIGYSNAIVVGTLRQLKKVILRIQSLLFNGVKEFGHPTTLYH